MSPPSEPQGADRSIWLRPSIFWLAAALCAAMSAVSFLGSQHPWFPWLGGLNAYNWAIRFSGLFAVSLVLAVSPSLRGWLHSAWSVVQDDPKKTPRTVYDNMDLMRLLLAVSVVVFHGFVQTGTRNYLYFAVPCFLTISGFVVLQSFEYSRSWLHFAWKRLLRVGPAFVVAVIFMGVILGTRSLLDTLHTWYTLGMTASIAGDGAVWSLGWEELFYGGLALLFVMGGYRRPFIIWALLILSVISIVIILPDAPHYQLKGIVLAPAFLIGNLFFMYRKRLERTPKWLPCVCFAAAVLCYIFRGDDVIIQFLVQCAFTATFIWFAAFGPTISRRLPFDLSYGIYLYNLPLMALIYMHGVKARWPLVGLMLLASLAVAACSWFGLERYALRLKDRFPRWRVRAATTPTCSS